MARVLFVDDDKVEQLFAREILSSRGHDVVLAENGEEALEIYQREGMYIDVVVTDLAMPRLNGLRLIAELRSLDPRVIILAASGRNADQLDLAEDAGVAAIFYKPWDPARFLRTLEGLVTRTDAEGRFIPDWSFRKAGT